MRVYFIIEESLLFLFNIVYFIIEESFFII